MDDEDYFVPDPETEWTCDICGCVLPRGHKDALCEECDTELRLLKLGKEWKYPYARED